jgi:hypothetical protein
MPCTLLSLVVQYNLSGSPALMIGFNFAHVQTVVTVIPSVSVVAASLACFTTYCVFIILVLFQKVFLLPMKVTDELLPVWIHLDVVERLSPSKNGNRESTQQLSLHTSS